MKVCTDACVLGATSDAKAAENLLDIGTGTGLLSLMMAQRFPILEIEAVEIDPLARQQTEENFIKSPWKNRLAIIEADIRQFATNTVKKYSHIICNPPFYDDHLKPESKANIVARHSEQLTLEELAKVVEQLMLPDGKFSVLLPPDAMKQLEPIFISKKITLNKKLLVKDREELPVIRVVGEFSFDNSIFSANTLTIKKDKEHYTEEFTHLLKDFYLAF